MTAMRCATRASAERYLSFGKELINLVLLRRTSVEAKQYVDLFAREL